MYVVIRNCQRLIVDVQAEKGDERNMQSRDENESSKSIRGNITDHRKFINHQSYIGARRGDEGLYAASSAKVVGTYRLAAELRTGLVQRDVRGGSPALLNERGRSELLPPLPGRLPLGLPPL